jgi:hypothetical protein
MTEQERKALEEEIAKLQQRPRTPKEDIDFLRPLWKEALARVKIYGDYDFSHIQNLPQPWRCIYTAFWLDAEVRNGGFHQFFWNSEGQLNTATEEDLGRIEAIEIQNIFRRAAACFIEFDVAGEKGRSKNTWEEFTAGYKTIPWKKFDTEYYEASPTLFQHLAKYIRAHQDEINDA